MNYGNAKKENLITLTESLHQCEGFFVFVENYFKPAYAVGTNPTAN